MGPTLRLATGEGGENCATSVVLVATTTWYPPLTPSSRNSVSPSAVGDGQPSDGGVLMPPTGCGVPKGSLLEARVAAKTSVLPDRSVVK